MKEVNGNWMERIIPSRVDEGVFPIGGRLSPANLPEADESWPTLGIEQGPLTRQVVATIEYDKKRGLTAEEIAIRVYYLTLHATAYQQYRDGFGALVHNLFPSELNENTDEDPDLVKNTAIDPPSAA